MYINICTCGPSTGKVFHANGLGNFVVWAKDLYSRNHCMGLINYFYFIMIKVFFIIIIKK